MVKISGLLLAGGHSSRMGKPKHLLKLKDDRIVYEHLLDVLRAALPKDSALFVSLRSESASGEMSIVSSSPSTSFKIIYDAQEQGLDIGPAAGLLAAHHEDSTSLWLVLACDYPLMKPEELARLLSSYAAPVTCMRNHDGFLEPLVAVWSPEALARLADSVAKGRTGPNRVIKELNGSSIAPINEQNLLNTNTPDDWQQALDILKDK